MISLYFCWRSGSAVTKRMSLRKVENLLDRNRYSHRADGDYMLHHKNDNNRGEAAVKIQGGFVFRLAGCTVRAEKGTCSASKGGTESLISDTSLCSVALMTRFNADVSAARA